MGYLGCSGIIPGFLTMAVGHLWMLAIVNEENELMGFLVLCAGHVFNRLRGGW